MQWFGQRRPRQILFSALGRLEQRPPAHQQGGAHRRYQEMPPDHLGRRQVFAAGGSVNLAPSIRRPPKYVALSFSPITI